MALKGARQVSVATSYLGGRTYDISEDGVIGYAAAHRESLLEHLDRAGQGRWTGLSSENVRAAHMTDSETGNALELEKGVRFFEWSAGVAASLSLTSKRPTKD